MEILSSLNNIYEKLYIVVQKQIYPQIDIVLNNMYTFTKEDKIVSMLEKIIDVFNGLSLSITISVFIVYIIKYIISLYSGENNPNIFKLIIKVIFVYILASNSMFIVNIILEVIMDIDNIINSGLKAIINKDITFTSLVNLVDPLKSDTYDFISLDGLVNGIVCYGSVNLLIGISIKFVLLFFLCTISPIIIMSLCFTDKGLVFKKWIKLIIYVILVPIVYKLLIFLPIAFKNLNKEIYYIFLLGVFNIIGKIDGYLKELIN